MITLTKGQRFLFIFRKKIIELIDPKTCKCIVRCSGSSEVPVGTIDYWPNTLRDVVDGYTASIIYLEGQDAPEA